VQGASVAPALSKTLRVRHLTMISIGGIIGAGVFVGSSAAAGVGAVFAGMTAVIFSRCGAEITTVAAAESGESGPTLARLTRNLIIRILLFYVLAIFLIVCIVPWTQIRPGDSPLALDRGRTHARGRAGAGNQARRLVGGSGAIVPSVLCRRELPLFCRRRWRVCR
jgi:L-asparagine transporter-like permease